MQRAAVTRRPFFSHEHSRANPRRARRGTSEPRYGATPTRDAGSVYIQPTIRPTGAAAGATAQRSAGAIASAADRSALDSRDAGHAARRGRGLSDAVLELRTVLRADLSLLLPRAAVGGRSPVKVLDCEQRSEAWRLARCGRLTASRAHVVLARGRRGGESVERATYRRQLVVERLTGIPDDSTFVSAAMERGRRLEPAARAAYAAHTGQRVATSGFILHDALEVGCSLDGHVEDFSGVVRIPGAVEIKAPNTTTHLRYWDTRRVPARYLAQITHHLWITGAAWCDFVSYDDRLPADRRLLVVRVERKHVDVDGYARAATRFLEAVAADVRALSTLNVTAMRRDQLRDVAGVVCMRAIELEARAPDRLRQPTFPEVTHMALA